MKKLGILLSGQGSNFLAIARSVQAGEIPAEITLVASNKPDAPGLTAAREMGLATTFFQIAIALGGVCLVVKKQWLWYVSMSVGVLATLQMAKVFLLK